MMMNNTVEINRELNIMGFDTVKAFIYATTIAGSQRADDILLQNCPKSDDFWTNMYVEKYVEGFEKCFKTFGLILPDVKKKALSFLQGNDVESFTMLCARLHIDDYNMAGAKEYYNNLAYSALEAIRRRNII